MGKRSCMLREMSQTHQAIVLIAAIYVIGIVIGVFAADNVIDSVNRTPGIIAGGDRIAPIVMFIFTVTSMALLAALIVSYACIYRKTRSRYVVSLLLFFIPMFIKSAFLIKVFRPLVQYLPQVETDIRQGLGFTYSGIGGVVMFVLFFEIIASSYLLYLSLK